MFRKAKIPAFALQNLNLRCQVATRNAVGILPVRRTEVLVVQHLRVASLAIYWVNITCGMVDAWLYELNHDRSY